MLSGIRRSTLSSEQTSSSSGSSNNNKGVVWEGDMESMSDSLQTLQTEDLSEEEDDNHHTVEAGAATAAAISRHTRRLSPISEGSSTPPFGIQRKSSTGSKDSASPTFLPPSLALPSSSPSTNAQAVASSTNPRTTITTNMAPLAPGEGQEEQQQASLVGNRAGNSTSTTSPTTTTTTNQVDEKAARRKRDFERAQKRAAKARVQHARRQQLDEVLVLYGMDPSKMKYDDVPHVLPNWEPPRKEPSLKSLQESSTSVTYDTSTTSLGTGMDESDASHATRKSVSFQTSSTSLHLGESSRSLGTTTTKSVKSALRNSKSKSERQLQLKKQGSVSFLPLVVVYDDDDHHHQAEDDNNNIPDQLDHSDASHWMDDSSSGRRSTTTTSQPWNDSSHFSTASLNDTSSQHSRRSISSSSYDKYTVNEMMTDAQQLLADMTPDEMAELYRRMEALGSVADSQSELMRLPNAQAKGALILTDDTQGRYYRLELEVLAQFMKDKIKAQKRERRRQRKLKQQSSSSRRHNNMSTSNEDSRSSSNIIVGESNAAPMAAVPLTPQEEKAARLAKRQQRRHDRASARRQTHSRQAMDMDQELPPLTDAPPSDQELSAAFSIDLDDDQHNDNNGANNNSNYFEASMHHLSLVDDMEKGHLTPTSSEEFEAPTPNQDTKKASTTRSNKKKNSLENSNDTLDLLESGIIEC